MSGKIKMYLTYAISFIGLFLIIWFLTGLFLGADNSIRKLAPIIISIIISPKPQVVETQSGKQYGLKSLFSKKVLWFKD